MKLSGLEPVSIDTGNLFVNIGERTNVTGSKAFARDLKHVDYNLYDAGHFALEEKGSEIAAKILSFMGGK